MTVFLDTSVLVAACEKSHPHFLLASGALSRIVKGTDIGYISAHSIAETYAALTRLPVQPRIHPSEATRLVCDGLIPFLRPVELDKEDYVHALKRTANAGLGGGKIYDALLLQCAEKCKTERIYTFNLSDLMALASPGQEGIIGAP